MNWMDIAILVVAGIAAFIGLRLGIIRIAVAAVGIGVGIVLASRLHEQVTPFFSQFIQDEDAARIAAFIAIFLAVVVLAGIASFLARKLIATLLLGWIDKLVGLALGVIIALALLSALLNTVQAFPILGLEETIKHSTLGSFLVNKYDIVLKVIRLIPNDFGG